MKRLRRFLQTKNYRYYLFLILLFIGIFLLFSYKLISVPPGINTDESSIGYNASLIARSLIDENGRFLPVFILTIGGKDWKQPITIYTTALLFKIFGASFYLLRLVSVIFALISSYIFLKILNLFFSKKMAIVGLLIFLSSPLLMIQSHLALENIALLPFLLGWLYFLLTYKEKKRFVNFFISGVLLGISFYSYKGMRAYVPSYFIITLFYLIYSNFSQKNKLFRSVAIFLFGFMPFILPIRWLQTNYAGAIWDPQIVSLPSFFDAAYTYLSSFDFSFLFVRGDKMLIHSTGYHGMFLIPALPLFFLGLFQVIKEKKIDYYLVLAVFLITPLFLFLVGSVYRASRLMPFLPLFAFIATLGIKRIGEFKQVFVKHALLIFFASVLIGSYINFINYYWGEYSIMARTHFSPNLNQAMADLANASSETGKKVYIEESEYLISQTDFDFFEQVYFTSKRLYYWIREVEPFPPEGIVLSTRGDDPNRNISIYKTIPNIIPGQTEFRLLIKK